jgi:hypothetical protein
MEISVESDALNIPGICGTFEFAADGVTVVLRCAAETNAASDPPVQVTSRSQSVLPVEMWIWKSHSTGPLDEKLLQVPVDETDGLSLAFVFPCRP